MDCQITHSGDSAEVALVGSLDSSWSPYLSDRLDEVIRTGIHEVRVDLSGISYLSSNGIALIVRYHRQMSQTGGIFRIVGVSETVCRVLDLTGVSQLLNLDGAGARGPAHGAASGATLDRAGMTLRLYRPRPVVADVGTLGRIGDPAKLVEGGYGPSDDRVWHATPDGVALGLGALGPDFESCRDRYGEFLAAAGVALYRPSAGPGRPDFEQATGAFLPEVRVLYGLTFAIRATAAMVRFEAKNEPDAGPVPLGELAGACLDESGSDTVGLVVVGETDGLVGAALRRSPAGAGDGTDPFEGARARDWLSMTPEPEFARSTALVVGVATRSASPALAPFVRPVAGPDAGGLRGHFHAAVVPFRPLSRGPLEMAATVHHLFEPGRVDAVLHLLNDARPIVGAGQSTFRRGAAWFVPLSVEG